MTHPVYSVPCPNGSLSMMACPPSLATYKELRKQGITAVVSLLPEEEAKALGVAKAAQTCDKLGLIYLSYPVKDFGLPQKASFAHLVQKVNVLLGTGDHVAVHCKAGIGRSGMLAACVLVSTGETPEQALKIVSDARGQAVPDTREQGDFVADFAAHWKKYPTLYR